MALELTLAAFCFRLEAASATAGANRHRMPRPLPVDPARAPEATPEQVGRATYAEWTKRLRKDRGLMGGTEPGAMSGGGLYSHGGDGGAWSHSRFRLSLSHRPGVVRRGSRPFTDGAELRRAITELHRRSRLASRPTPDAVPTIPPA